MTISSGILMFTGISSRFLGLGLLKLIVFGVDLKLMVSNIVFPCLIFYLFSNERISKASLNFFCWNLICACDNNEEIKLSLLFINYF